ncbi:hypothetical protein ACVWWG_004644 [Bradyrhizobium sp. LB7.2]
MGPKRLVDHHAMAAGVLIGRIFDPETGRSEAPADDAEIEENFYLAPEGGTLSENARPEATMAVVGAAFEAATSQDQRRKLLRSQALCAIIQPPTPAWAGPVSAYFRTVFGDRWVHHVNYGTEQTAFQDRAGSSAVSLALSAGQSVVGISADVSLLPRSLLGAADLMVRLPPASGAMVRSAIVRFAGRVPVELEDSIFAELDLDDLVAALRPGTGPERIVQRLAAAAAALRVRRDLKKEE